MSTKKCKHCQTEIDEKAKRCPHCQGDLRSWFARHPILTVLLVLFLLPIVIILAVDNNTKPSTDSQTTEQKQETTRELIGKVNFDGTQFHITNQENTAWKNCGFTVNGNYHYPSVKGFMGGETEKIGVIEANNSYSIGAAQFTLKDGTRFNPFEKKPQNFSVNCDNGFQYWEW